MPFGIYVHIPYCLQRCSYCDFATFVQNEIPPPEKYIPLLLQEIRSLAPLYREAGLHSKPLTSIYFGGGTPSLIDPQLIVAVLKEISKQGFRTGPDTEVTLEINPATLSDGKMQAYLDGGINRFSVGAQTFNDSLLKMVHREHNSQQTRDTLNFLKSHGVNYSFDLLFALPHQNLEMLKADLDEVLSFLPNHVSPYCLTVPEAHPLTANRPTEEHQIEMFGLIDKTLTTAGYQKYEISNFCQPSFESRHNSLYWQDAPYWGVGLSSHSYRPDLGPWGLRYWNAKTYSSYEAQINSLVQSEAASLGGHVKDYQHEFLKKHEALTDFIHTSLRRAVGLSESKLRDKFGEADFNKVRPRLEMLRLRQLLELRPQMHWALTSQGQILSNLVFEELAFLEDELN
jgi:oxygen-independent coproporphyrinogen-3 oxidase